MYFVFFPSQEITISSELAHALIDRNMAAAVINNVSFEVVDMMGEDAIDPQCEMHDNIHEHVAEVGMGSARGWTPPAGAERVVGSTL